ncbi:transporter substrate-binding domain-containing protein [bacterium 19MO03SA05]|uniref:Transporter substrate-binding domain-containing protein n=4 Tax=Bacteria TaxID=2 RepID=A0AAU6UNI7_UNCXX|nr:MULTISPECIES: transporter substrate-binding domain-containing protein [unclassified Vibrio]EKO3579641.1 transporter substrate-binding domain-containing protein [Vibrio metschnikovii]EKO3640220.1 transporter substrate-binding domain-containing protein [Vibrio metschnikovii]EKO3643932.1 transporter substrate-binding domain-containing protein [Vibrio metschnikovii]EKO3677697.1 transporter substrate-binding domain-containing protein [Vibrio metschnikovii]EKO3919709.1 transporter substrate-bindi
MVNLRHKKERKVIMNELRFWNGNKSLARQQHEFNVLSAIQQGGNMPWSIIHDTTDYPNAEDESRIFQRGADLLTTVAGNRKFAQDEHIAIHQPICGGILGCRILVIRTSEQALFDHIEESALKNKIAGIPATWADADLLRYNGYQVLEKGSLDQMFLMLREGLCDFIPLGINEVQSLFKQSSNTNQEITIETNMMLFYPLPIVFYLHPQRLDLKKSIERGIEKLTQNGTLQRIYRYHYQNAIQSMTPEKRRIIQLTNPNLNQHWLGFKAYYMK